MTKPVIVTKYEAADGTLHSTATAAALHNLERDANSLYTTDPISQAVDWEPVWRWLVRNRTGVEKLYKELDKLE